MTVDISVSLIYGWRRPIQKIDSQKIKAIGGECFGQANPSAPRRSKYREGGMTLCWAEETICLFSYCYFAVAVIRIMVVAAALIEETVTAVTLFFGSYCLTAFAATKTAAANKLRIHTNAAYGLRRLS